MYCSKCGTANDDNAYRCIQCGNYLQGAPSQPAQQTYYPQANVPNYLVQAILCTLFCCLPFGIVAIVYAAQVNSKLTAGDYAGAVASSNSARTWCWAAFGSGLALCLIYFVLALLGALANAH